MRKHKRIISLISCIVFLSACGQVENLVSIFSDANDETPVWIEFIDSSLSNGNMIYVRIDEHKIWEPGDEVISLGKQISQSLRVTIDGNIIPKEQVIVLDIFAPPIYVYDDSGNVVGSHKGTAHIYFFVPTIEGVHIASIQITSTSGIQYTYTWEFEVSSDYCDITQCIYFSALIGR